MLDEVSPTWNITETTNGAQELLSPILRAVWILVDIASNHKEVKTCHETVAATLAVGKHLGREVLAAPFGKRDFPPGVDHKDCLGCLASLFEFSSHPLFQLCSMLLCGAFPDSLDLNDGTVLAEFNLSVISSRSWFRNCESKLVKDILDPKLELAACAQE